MPKATVPFLMLGAALCATACSPKPRAASVVPAPQIASAPVPEASCGCTRKVRGPDVVEHWTDRVLVTAAGASQQFTPAVTRQETRSMVVRPAWTETVTRPAVFKTVWRSETSPGRTYDVQTPARWRIVSERALIAPAHTVWKQGSGRPVAGPAVPGYSAYAPTGEVMCSVLIPARYAVRSRRVLVSPPGRRTVQGPSIVRRVAEKVEIAPAVTRRIEHPAVTRTHVETVVVTPARTVMVRTPPAYRDAQRTRRTPHYVVQPAPCPKAKPARVHRRPTPPAPRVHRAPRPMEQPYRLPSTHTPYGERG